MKRLYMFSTGEKCLRLCYSVIVLTFFTYTISFSQVNQQKILDYDDYGNPVKVQDANGNMTIYYYGSEDYPFSQNGENGTNGVYLTGIQRVIGSPDCTPCNDRNNPGINDDLFTEAVYDDLGQLVKIIDENGKENKFGYDSFGRLNRTWDSNNFITSSYSYFYSKTGNNGVYSSTNPNHVQSITYPGFTTDGLVGHWQFEYNSDHHSNDNLNGTLYGSSDVSQQSYFGRGLTLSGVNSSYVNLGNNSSLRPDWITIMGWIKPTASGSGRRQIVTQENYGYRFSYTNDGIRLLIKLNDSDQANQWGEVSLTGSNTVNLNEWNHVAATFDTDRRIRIYVNGELTGTSQQYTGGGGRITYTGTAATTVGRGNSSSWRGPFDGFIDELKIYNRALSPSEIAADYKAIVNTTYMDGLGREIQTQQSTGGGDAIVQHTFYDAMGREEVVTKPIETLTSATFVSPTDLIGSGWQPGDPITATTAAQRDYYKSQGISTSDAQYSYSQTAYEASPLGRVLKQAAPGNIFKMSGSRTVDIEYGLNTTANEDFGGSGELGFGNNTLHRQEVTDENYNKSWQFTDGWGRTVMEVVDHDGNNLVSSSAADDIFTGYEYDLLGNLLKVHEPKGWGDSTNYIREYTYDELGRLVSENTPDLEATTDYKYDKAGNLRFVRNAEHKKSSSCGSFNFQDQFFNDPILDPINCNKTGLIEYTKSISTSGDVVVKFEFQKNDSPWVTLKRSQEDSWDLYPGETETMLVSEGNYRIKVEVLDDYSQEQWTGSVDGDFKPFTFQYNKYDELGRLIESGEYYGSSSNFNDSNAESATFPTSSKQAFVKYYYDDNGYSGARNLKGRIARTEYLDSNTWRWGDTWYSYNNEGQVEWVRQDLPYYNGFSSKLIEYSYNRQGQLTQMNYQPNSAADRLNIWYDYDPAGRLHQVWTSRANIKADANLEATYTYNADGQVARQSLGGDLTEGAQLIENVYHIRGWLSKINDPDNLTSPSGFPDSRFALDLNYETCLVNCSAENDNWFAQYNGNISQSRWAVSPPNALANDSPIYNYTYDEANQLTKADYHNSNAGSSDYDVPTIDYDKSGNFVGLTRYRNSSTSDGYDYRYYSGTNRLMNVADSPTAQHYTYDRIGNMVSNQDRGITSMTYNGSNLPTRLVQTVSSSSANLHEYSYDSDGNRVRKRFSGGGATTYVRGADGQVIAVYQGSTLQFWNLPGGIGRVTK